MGRPAKARAATAIALPAGNKLRNNRACAGYLEQQLRTSKTADVLVELTRQRRWFAVQRVELLDESSSQL